MLSIACCASWASSDATPVPFAPPLPSFAPAPATHVVVVVLGAVVVVALGAVVVVVVVAFGAVVVVVVVVVVDPAVVEDVGVQLTPLAPAAP